MDKPGQTDAALAPFSARYRAWLLFTLSLLTALNLADRQGMAAIAPAVKRDLLLSDTELGMILGLGFAIFFALMSLPVALLGDHFRRDRRASAQHGGVAGAPLGAVDGAVLGGYFAQYLGRRSWFLVLGVVSRAVALLCWFTLPHPPRGTLRRDLDTHYAA